MSLLRLLLTILTLLGSGFASETQYPLWDGHESVADYAKKVNLPTTKTLDLGNGVKMELVLIPAGKFIMGTPEPTPVDEERYQKGIATGQFFLAVTVSMLLILFASVIVPSIRKRRRPQLSLRLLLLLTLTAGGCILSGLHWLRSEVWRNAARYKFASAKNRITRTNSPSTR